MVRTGQSLAHVKTEIIIMSLEISHESNLPLNSVLIIFTQIQVQGEGVQVKVATWRETCHHSWAWRIDCPIGHIQKIILKLCSRWGSSTYGRMKRSVCSYEKEFVGSLHLHFHRKPAIINITSYQQNKEIEPLYHYSHHSYHNNITTHLILFNARSWL